MSQYKYITCRTLVNATGKEAGLIRAAVKNDSDLLEGEYACPECLHKGKVNQVFHRPLHIRCEKCSFVIRVSRLKGKVK